MTEDDNAEQRLNDLESQLAIQNNVIDELSDTLKEQWEKIDELTSLVRKLNDRMSVAEGELHSVLPPDRPPPHY